MQVDYAYVGEGVVAIDTEYVRPRMDASHLIVDQGRAAFVDTGTSFSVPKLIGALAALGLDAADVDYILLTHIHLDHAGGAGRLAQELPRARILVHPRGAAHLSDPSKLIAATKAVYGERLFSLRYGEIPAVPAERIVAVEDGDRVTLGGRTLEFIHTPGHALHHVCIVDREAGEVFSGDTFGVSYRELDTAQGEFIFTTTTPTQFDPGQHIASIERMLSYSPEAMYLMHFSRVTDVARLAVSLKEQIAAHASIAHAHARDADPAAGIKADLLGLWLKLVRQHGVRLSDAAVTQMVAGDLELNTQGLVAYLARLAPRKDTA